MPASDHEEKSSGGACLNPFTTAASASALPSRLPVVVLAGGRSARFGRDKLAALIDGRAALAHVVERVEPLASEVIVATSSADRQRALAPLLGRNVRFLLDRPRRWGPGPAGAMAGALEAVASGPVLFVPGDIPWAEAEALRRFVGTADANAAEVAVPYWQSGETEHLIQWHRSRETLRHLPRPMARDPGGGRASVFLRAVPRTLLVPVRGLSDRPVSFSHLTYASDLEGPTLRGEAGESAVTRIIEGTPKRKFFEAHSHLDAGRPREAARSFSAESRWYSRSGLPLLARHANADVTGAVEDRILGPSSRHRHRPPSLGGGSGRAMVNPRARLGGSR